MIKTPSELMRFRVVTDVGTVETVAASLGRAKRNAKYRLVMRDRAYRDPTPTDLASMRDIEVLRCERLEILGARLVFYAGGSSALRIPNTRHLPVAGFRAPTPPPGIGSEKSPEGGPTHSKVGERD